MSLEQSAFAPEFSSDGFHKRGAPSRFQIPIVANDSNILYVFCRALVFVVDSSKLNSEAKEVAQYVHFLMKNSVLYTYVSKAIYIVLF